MLAQFQNCPSGHTFENTAFWRAENIIFDSEYVEACAFGNIAIPITQNGHESISVIGLKDAHGEVEPVEVLDARVHRLWCNTMNRAYNHGNALPALIVIRNPDKRRSESIKALGTKTRITATSRRHSPCACHLHIGVAQTAQTDTFDEDLGDLLTRVGQRHTKPTHGRKKPFDMVVKTKEAPLPDMRNVISGVRTHEAAIKNWNAGIGNWHIAPVNECNAPLRVRNVDSVFFGHVIPFRDFEHCGSRGTARR